MERQCWNIERALRDDFRMLLFLRDELAESKQKVLEDKLLALPDVEEARYVSRREALADLRREDPELVQSVSLLGENPLSPAYEVRFAPGGFGNVPRWLALAAPLADWAEVRYKGGQIRAILQAQFLGHFLNLAWSAVICLTALMGLTGLWSVVRKPKGWAWRWAHSPAALAAGAAGAAGGAGLAALTALPMKILNPWWAWPSAGRQGVILMGAAVAGWLLCAHGD